MTNKELIKKSNGLHLNIKTTLIKEHEKITSKHYSEHENINHIPTEVFLTESVFKGFDSLKEVSKFTSELKDLMCKYKIKSIESTHRNVNMIMIDKTKAIHVVGMEIIKEEETK